MRSRDSEIRLVCDHVILCIQQLINKVLYCELLTICAGFIIQPVQLTMVLILMMSQATEPITIELVIPGILNS